MRKLALAIKVGIVLLAIFFASILYPDAKVNLQKTKQAIIQLFYWQNNTP